MSPGGAIPDILLFRADGGARILWSTILLVTSCLLLVVGALVGVVVMLVRRK